MVQSIMIENSARRYRQYIAVLAGSLTCFSAGTSIAWSSQIANDLLHGKLGFKITEDQLGWTGSLLHLGAATLALFAGTLADLIGRKFLMLLLVLPATIGWSMLIFANSVAMLYSGRFITGMITGGFTVLMSIYSSEIAQKEIRGALGSYTQLMISLGILYASLLAPFMSYKYYTTCCAVVPIIFAVLFITMPESPVYLLKKNNIKRAHSALLQLRGKNYNIDKEITDIQSRLETERLNSGYRLVLQSLRKSSTKKACLIGIGLMFLKSTCGVDALTAYAVYIFSNANIGIPPSIGVIILCIAQAITSVIQSLVVDRYGRKILLCISGSIMSLCLIVVGLTFLLKERQIVSQDYHVYINYVPLVGIVLFSVAFSLGVGPIPWLMMGEVFPQEIKSLASSIGTFVTWMTAFLVTKLFILIDSSLGSDIAFFIFALCTGGMVIFVIVLVPETKNKSFEEIQKDLE